jgi:hypothetical protein
MKKRTGSTAIVVIAAGLFLAACGLFKRVPHSTFSLNGNWTMISTSDEEALLGSTITVQPLDADGYAVVSMLNNNAYCVRPNDIIWKDIVSVSAGFNLNNLCNSCISSLEYRPATIMVLTNDSLRLAGTTRSGKDLVQTWKRVAK